MCSWTKEDPTNCWWWSWLWRDDDLDISVCSTGVWQQVGSGLLGCHRGLLLAYQYRSDSKGFHQEIKTQTVWVIKCFHLCRAQESQVCLWTLQSQSGLNHKDHPGIHVIRGHRGRAVSETSTGKFRFDILMMVDWHPCANKFRYY